MLTVVNHTSHGALHARSVLEISTDVNDTPYNFKHDFV